VILGKMGSQEQQSLPPAANKHTIHQMHLFPNSSFAYVMYSYRSTQVLSCQTCFRSISVSSTVCLKKHPRHF